MLNTLSHLLLLSAVLASFTTNAGEWASNVSAELTAFVQEPAYTGQHDSYASVAFETLYTTDWNNGDDLFAFKPFYRFDQYDDERTHGDIRELSWIHVGEDWELLAGISKVFWGATEAVHLVDIINQTDFVENQDGEDKLGQPMIKLTLLRDWGVLDVFMLPTFRERTYASLEGRPRIGIVIDDAIAAYESGDEDKHLDLALRWSDTLGDWDVGVSHFSGTTREPTLLPGPPGFLHPYYELIEQTGLDVQSSIEGWLFKLEAITRSGQGQRFSAAAAGIEATIVGVYESDVDIGVIAEYLYDERTTSPFQNDLVLGARIAMNDVDGTELLISTIFDLEGDGQNYNIEGSRRLGASYKASIEARGVINPEPGSPFASFKNDNYVKLEMTYYF